MKKILILAGVAVLLCSINLRSAEPQDKPWNISATVRGFYDDNYLTRHSKAMGKRDSYGFEVSPYAKLAIRQEMTTLEASYRYSMRYYEDRKDNRADHSHDVNLSLTHRFSDRCKLSIDDSFVVAQEPQVMDPVLVTVPLRTEGNNIRNKAGFDLSYKITDSVAIEPGYSFIFYDYQQTGPMSRSALLDRYENLAYVNLRWINMLENTDGLIGYQFGNVNHNSKDPILLPLGVFVPSDVRDNRSHYAYVGAEHRFTELFSVKLLVGAQYTEYYQSKRILSPLLGSLDDTTVNPFVDASLLYSGQYGEFQLGVRHSRSQSDLVILDAEATAVYGSFTKEIFGGFKAGVVGMHQFSTFEDPVPGGLDDKSEGLTLLGFNVSYEFNKFISAEAGYNYDLLASDVLLRSYHRNRVYIGVRGSF